MLFGDHDDIFVWHPYNVWHKSFTYYNEKAESVQIVETAFYTVTTNNRNKTELSSVGVYRGFFDILKP